MTQPEIEFTTRPATFADIPLMVNLENLCSIAEVGKPTTSINEYEAEFKTEGFDPERDTLLMFHPNGDLVGIVGLYDTHEPHTHAYVWTVVHPDFATSTIRAQLLDWADQRAQRMLELAPPDAKISLFHGTLSTNTSKINDLKQHGYVLARHFWRMVVDLPDHTANPTLPEGVIIRSYHPETELPLVLQVRRDSFKDHWGYIEMPFEQELREWQDYIKVTDTYDPNIFFVAMAGDEVAGIALCWTHLTEDPDMGWVGILGVTRNWRRKGIAQALLHHSFNAFEQRGKQRVGLAVDAASLTGATALYERVGMKVTRQNDSYQKVIRDGIDLSIQEVAE